MDKNKKHKDILAEEKTNPFLIPDGYFENLSSNILLELDIEEPATDVPSGYFESLSERVLEKSRPQAVVKKINSKRIITVAACFLVILSSSLLLAPTDDSLNGFSDNSLLTDIDQDELIDYLTYNDEITIDDLLDTDMDILSVIQDDTELDETNEEIYLDDIFSELTETEIEELL